MNSDDNQKTKIAKGGFLHWLQSSIVLKIMGKYNFNESIVKLVASSLTNF